MEETAGVDPCRFNGTTQVRGIWDKDPWNSATSALVTEGTDRLCRGPESGQF
jgi:hypothetical protein